MTDTKPAEPSMEEILASIRQIINQNDAPEGGDEVETSALAAPADDASAIDDAPEDEDVLELTTILEDEPIMAETTEMPQAVTMDDPFAQVSQGLAELEPVIPTPTPAPQAPAASAQELITGITAAAATAALNNLAATLQNERAEHSLPMGNGGRTLESMVVEAIKPLLKEWLDENLTGIVERVVTQEVEKLTRRLGG